jgi:hypothetical protein
MQRFRQNAGPTLLLQIMFNLGAFATDRTSRQLWLREIGRQLRLYYRRLEPTLPVRFLELVEQLRAKETAPGTDPSARH